MHLPRAAVALAALLPTLGLLGPARGSDDAPVRMLVRFAPGVDGGDRSDVERRAGGRLRRSVEGGRLVALELGKTAVESLRRDPRVASVEPDPVYRLASLSKSELQPALGNGLYGLVLTRALAAQTRKVTGAGVLVCVADSGLDAHHPDLSPSYRGGFDLVDGDGDPDIGDDPGLGEHGSMVTGIIAAALNGKGVRGMAYGARVRHARVIGPDGTGRGSDIMAAVEHFLDVDGCRVVNLSLGTSQRTEAEEHFYRDLLARHPEAIVVAASGNDGVDSVIFPAAYDGVVAVGAVGPDSALASFSNRGPELALVAPGVNVLSAVPRGAGSEAFVTAGRPLAATPFVFGGQTRGVRAQLVDCGTGNTLEEFPASVRGKIALMKRGDAYFSVKVQNAMDAGARAALVYNNVEEPVHGTLQTPTAADDLPWIPAVLVSASDGDYLRKFRKLVLLVNSASDWDSGSGTSFATPHVVGAVALVLSVRPQLSRDEVVDLLESTALDLGDPGFDTEYGWGLVDVDAATRAAANR
jgi:subtilisin family serine protease